MPGRRAMEPRFSDRRFARPDGRLAVHDPAAPGVAVGVAEEDERVPVCARPTSVRARASKGSRPTAREPTSPSAGTDLRRVTTRSCADTGTTGPYGGRIGWRRTARSPIARLNRPWTFAASISGGWATTAPTHTWGCADTPARGSSGHRGDTAPPPSICFGGWQRHPERLTVPGAARRQQSFCGCATSQPARISQE